MKNIDQKYHRQSIISDYCNQIIHRRDQRTGCNCRINMDLVEEHRDDRTYKPEITIATTREIPTHPEIRNADIQAYFLNRWM